MGAAIAVGASASYNLTFDLGTIAEQRNGIEIYIDFGAMVLTTTKVTVSDLWLATADITTTLMPDHFHEMRESCKPHYQKTFEYATRPAQNTGLTSSPLTMSGSGQDITFQWDHNPPLMRSGALIQTTTYNPGEANDDARNDNSETASYVGIYASRSSRTLFNINSSAAGDPNRQWFIHAAIDAEWYD
jgi:hypothetical protein